MQAFTPFSGVFKAVWWYFQLVCPSLNNHSLSLPCSRKGHVRALLTEQDIHGLTAGVYEHEQPAAG